MLNEEEWDATGEYGGGDGERSLAKEWERDEIDGPVDDSMWVMRYMRAEEPSTIATPTPADGSYNDDTAVDAGAC